MHFVPHDFFHSAGLPGSGEGGSSKAAFSRDVCYSCTFSGSVGPHDAQGELPSHSQYFRLVALGGSDPYHSLPMNFHPV